MAEPFIAEMSIMSFNFAPKGWALCNGQVMSIQQNLALFSLVGTQFGGNGSTTFALPDLRGRTPVDCSVVDGSYKLGQTGGEEAHTLVVSELPKHPHPFQASTQNGNVANPTGAVLATFSTLYGPPTQPTAVGQSAPYGPMIGDAGGSAPHENRMPYTVLNICIALVGLYPSKN
jgi:microcystin-dependent protein